MAGGQDSGRLARTRGIAVCLFLHLIAEGFCNNTAEMSTVGGVWPKPQKQDLRDQYVGVSDSFGFKVVGKSCDILTAAMSRYKDLLKTNWRPLTKFDLVNTSANIIGKTTKLEIDLKNDCEKYPHLDMDEKYTLEVKRGASLLTADSIWGILRGLETFCQLPAPNKELKQLIIQVQTIEDFPKYPHRGLLIDTSRHYLTLSTIKRQVDIMSYNKMNVLHWHIIDDPSFPYQSKKFPSLSEKGAYSPDAVYTMAMIQEVVEHARLRGVRVIPELDSPGHDDSFEPSMPNIHSHCPDEKRPGHSLVGPLDPTKNETYEFINALLDEALELFPDGYVHLGGDEVDHTCWRKDPAVKSFVDAHKWTWEQLHSYYMQNIIKHTKKLSRKAIVWEEVFFKWANFNGKESSFDKDTIVQLWKHYKLWDVKTVVSKGFKVINSNGWYLDELKIDFQKLYAVDLSTTGDLTDEEEKLFLGGEACMWGEMVDDTNIEPRVWPRACAIAEHLWSAPKTKDSKLLFRITEHVCRLKRRGIQASPSHKATYCSDVLPHASPSFFSLSNLRQRLGMDDGDSVEDQEVNSTHSESVNSALSGDHSTHSKSVNSALSGDHSTHSESVNSALSGESPTHSKSVNSALSGDHSTHSESVYSALSGEEPSGVGPVNNTTANSKASVPGISALVLSWTGALLLRYY